MLKALNRPRLGFIKPQMPTLVPEPPAGGGWLHEIKHDGYRTLSVIDGSSVCAFTRNGHDWTERYGPIIDACGKLNCRSAIIDGELIVQDANGVSDFAGLRRAIAREPHRLVLFAFDLLHLDGQDLRRLPLLERKLKLRDLIPPDERFPIQFCQHMEGDGVAIFATAAEMGLEGIVSKKATSRYRSGPSANWLKTKCWEEGEFIILGCEQEKGVHFLILAREDEDGLTFAGTAFIGLAGDARNELREAMECMKVSKPAIRSLKRKDAQWVTPALSARVRYLRGGGMLRHASVKELVRCG